MTGHKRDEWTHNLFRLRGFGHIDVGYDPMRDRRIVTVARHVGGDTATIDAPDNYASMPLEAFRHWVDAEVEKISGPSDFPAVSFNNVVPT